MRIWYQSMTELERVPEYAAVLREHIGVATSGDVRTDLVGLAPNTYGGRAPMDVLRYPLGFHRALGQVLDNVLDAAEQGYDAFLMGSFVAPFLREARCAVDIPVTSMTESVLLAVRPFTRRVAMICINDEQVGTASELVGALGLADWVAATTAIDRPATEITLSQALTSGGGPLAESFVRTCEKAVDAGADVLVPAEGILSEMVRACGLSQVRGAPVVDCVQTAITHAVASTGLLRAGALGIGRRSYPRQDGDAPALAGSRRDGRTDGRT